MDTDEARLLGLLEDVALVVRSARDAQFTGAPEVVAGLARELVDEAERGWNWEAADALRDLATRVTHLASAQPSLPMRPGRAGTMTHDYKRNGTTDLFAAMNLATGGARAEGTATIKAVSRARESTSPARRLMAPP